MRPRISFDVESFLAGEFLKYNRRFENEFSRNDLLVFKEVIDVDSIQDFVDEDIFSLGPVESSIARRNHKKRLSHLTRIFAREISKRKINRKNLDRDVIVEVHLIIKAMSCSIYPCVKNQGK